MVSLAVGSARHDDDDEILREVVNMSQMRRIKQMLFTSHEILERGVGQGVYVRLDPLRSRNFCRIGKIYRRSIRSTE